jgi:hypothetical protein
MDAVTDDDLDRLYSAVVALYDFPDDDELAAQLGEVKRLADDLLFKMTGSL